jgi:hypothetical protein
MSSVLVPVLLFVAYFSIQLWLLPRLGVST